MIRPLSIVTALTTLVVLALAFHVFGQEPITDVTPPPRTDSTQAVVAWDPNTEPDIAGYQLYTSYDGVLWEPHGERTTATYGVVQRDPDSPVQVYVVAVDTNGLVSPPSPTITVKPTSKRPAAPTSFGIHLSATFEFNLNLPPTDGQD